MSRYPFAPKRLTDGVGLVVPRTHERHHEDDAMPFESTVRPYENLFVRRSYRTTGDVSDALLSLTDRRSGGNTAPKVRMKLNEMSPRLEMLKETQWRKRAEANKIRRREQCRANQARYRDKQRHAQLQLESNVELLNTELDNLKRRHRDLLSRERSTQSPWSIVAEVFRLIESSFRSPWRATDRREMKTYTETHQILTLLARAFAHNAAIGELQGIDALMDQLRLYSQCFGSPKLQLQRVESVTPGVMTAVAKLSLTVTEVTLQHVFPHLAESTDDADDRCELNQRLLGQRLDCSSSMTFLFDEDSGRVVRLVTCVDVVTPLLRVLGNIKDVLDVLEHSRMTAECTISGPTRQ